MFSKENKTVDLKALKVHQEAGVADRTFQYLSGYMRIR